MGRRTAKNGSRFKPLLDVLRFLLFCAFCYGAYIGLKYIFARSDAEVMALKNRPQSQYYLQVDKTVQMTVINQDGELVMEISGDKVTMSADQRKVIFSGGKATYYEDGAVSLTMGAGEIEYDTQSEDFNLRQGLSITTKDGMSVRADEVEWRRFKESLTAKAGRPPSFRFPKGVLVTSSDGNTLQADYMQADRELTYMEMVGHVTAKVVAMTDTEFITERELTDVKELQLKDFEALTISAEQVIYDKRGQVMLATSRFYDRAFKIKDFNGNIVQPSFYQRDPQQVVFAKKEINIGANHLEAHVARKWMECYGDINILIPRSEPKAGDDKALQSVKQYDTKIACGDVEYFWGRDYVISHTPTRVEQGDRLAMANRITYSGDERLVLLDGAITLAQGSGDWLISDDLIDVRNNDQSRIMTGYSEMHADRAAMYLNNNDFIASGGVILRQDNRETAADVVAYQDEIKLLTAKGNVKFKDIDGQTFVCGSLRYDNKNEVMQISQGLSASMLLPAKFANDLNRALAEAREEPVPPEISDPPVPAEPQHNPNANSRIRTPVVPPPAPPPISAGAGLPIPGEPPKIGGSSEPKTADTQPKELVLNLGDEDDEENADKEPAGTDKPGGADKVKEGSA